MQAAAWGAGSCVLTPLPHRGRGSARRPAGTPRALRRPDAWVPAGLRNTEGGRKLLTHVRPVSLLAAEGALGQTPFPPSDRQVHTAGKGHTHPPSGQKQGGTSPHSPARPSPAHPARLAGPRTSGLRHGHSLRGGTSGWMDGAPCPVGRFTVTGPAIAGGCQRPPAAHSGGSVPLTPAPRGASRQAHLVYTATPAALAERGHARAPRPPGLGTHGPALSASRAAAVPSTRSVSPGDLARLEVSPGPRGSGLGGQGQTAAPSPPSVRPAAPP